MRLRLLLVPLLLVFVSLPAQTATAGGSRPCYGAFLDQVTVDVGTEQNCFVPAVARIDVGDTVTWRNIDGMHHNVTTSAGFGGDLPPKQDLSHRFTEAGVFPYACTLHPGMVGAIVVGDGMPAKGAAAATAGADDAAGTEGAAEGAPTELASAATRNDDGSAWRLIAGALALLLGLSFASGRMRRQRPAGSAAS